MFNKKIYLNNNKINFNILKIHILIYNYYILNI